MSILNIPSQQLSLNTDMMRIACVDYVIRNVVNALQNLTIKNSIIGQLVKIIIIENVSTIAYPPIILN